MPDRKLTTVPTFAKITSTYDPYGNEITSSNLSNYGYQQYEKDRENNLSYLHARYYDPTTGRFIARDPVAGALKVPESQNGYSYAHNNPVNLSDPSGELVPVLAALLYLGFAAWSLADMQHAAETCDNVGFGVAALGLIPGAGPLKVGSKAAPLVDRALLYTLGNAAKTIGGRVYTGHALDAMQNVGIYPSAVENTIKWGQQVASSAPGTIRRYEPTNNISVVTNTKGEVVTVFYGR